MTMQRRNDYLIPLLTVLSDIFTLEGAFLISYWLRFYSPLTASYEVTLGVPPLSGYIFSSFFFIPVWLFVFQSRGLYGTRRNTHLSDEFFAIIRVITIGLFIVMGIAFFYREFSFSRGVFILLWSTSIATTTTGRFIIMEFEKFLYRRGKELKSVVLVGNNSMAGSIYTRLKTEPAIGYEVLGYYSDDRKQDDPALKDCSYLGLINQLPRDIDRLQIQTVLVSLPFIEHMKLLDLARDAEGRNIEVMMVPDMLDLMTSHVRLKEIEGIPFLKIKDVSLSPWSRVTKRIFDLFFSLIVLLLTSPLLLLITLLIKMSSKGSVLFTQERVGLDSIPFQLYKFRSMRTDAESETGPIRATPGDTRTFPLGKLLRRTSLDELPQLWNVLMGTMSIVGPRPERQFFVEQFTDKIPRYMERHRVKSGMTGWAQVNGLRGNAPITERTKYDIYYVENWSIVFDLKIILKTIYAVIFGKDAY
jgi:exopolysaccharide biosynthesis polyprenyl glycosylphosphotransferase